MFFELAVSIKASLIIFSIIGMFLSGAFERLPWPWNANRHTSIVHIEPKIDNVWAALDATGAIPDDVTKVHQQEQETAQQDSDNAARVALYAAKQTATTQALRSGNRTLMFGALCLTGIVLPIPKKRQKELSA